MAKTIEVEEMLELRNDLVKTWCQMIGDLRDLLGNLQSGQNSLAGSAEKAGRFRKQWIAFSSQFPDSFDQLIQAFGPLSALEETLNLAAGYFTELVGTVGAVVEMQPPVLIPPDEGSLAS